MDFLRALELDGLWASAFLFGPRMTGKSHLLRPLKSSLSIDLLDPEIELELRQTPRLFWEQIRTQGTNSKSLVTVDLQVLKRILICFLIESLMRHGGERGSVFWFDEIKLVDERILYENE